MMKLFGNNTDLVVRENETCFMLEDIICDTKRKKREGKQYKCITKEKEFLSN